MAHRSILRQGIGGIGSASGAARDVALALLAARAAEATVCPSEVARAMIAARSGEAAGNWRSAMPAVHAAIDGLLAEKLVRLSWQGTTLATRSGPYRIGRGTQTLATAAKDRR